VPLANPSIRQAAILVGGLGTRLGTLTAATPKPLLPCGDRPFLAWLLRELCRFGIREALLLTGHLGETIEAAVPAIAASLPHALHITCVREARQAGTGGALFQARDHLAERFLLCNGDSWLDFNLTRLLADAAGDPADVLCRMTLRRLDDASRYGVAETDGDRVTGFRERPDPGQPGTINAGLYLLDRRVLEVATPVCSLERDILPKLAAQDRLRSTLAQGYFLDIGIPSDLARAQTELPPRLHRRALFLNHDVIVDVDHGRDGSGDQFGFVTGAFATIRQASDAGWHVFIAEHRPDAAKPPPLCDRALHEPMIEAIRAAGGTVDDMRYGPRSASTSHHPINDREPGVLGDLVSDWELDPARCLLIGNHATDLAAAAAVGIPAHRFAGGSLADFTLPLLATDAST
jgi:dTDP-glucose pyrophosphorylase/histidinol phosphatase-like enzyme